MSFRLFIYYSALCGGAGGFLGWALGRGLVSSRGILGTGLLGMWLGLGVALALGLLDALWVHSLRRLSGILARVLTALMVGALGGLVGGILAQSLYEMKGLALFLVLGWTLTGLLIGAAPGMYDLVVARIRGQATGGTIRKVRNGVLGGGLGGFLGGIVYLFLRGAWLGIFQDKPEHQLWSPSAIGFVALGACIGLLIALAQVILREAWLRVEAGFRPGREQILSRPEITIGRAESCDIGLFGDPAVDKLHATIRRQGSSYVVQDEGSSSGTYVNDQRITGPRVLASGDRIRLGRCLLRYGERQKRRD